VSRPAALSLALALALGASGVARAQGQDQTLLPVYNNASGKVEAYLELQPTDAGAGARWKFGSTTLDAAFGLDRGDSLALLCDRKNGVSSAIAQLASHCMLASLDADSDASDARRTTAIAALSRPGGRLGLALGKGRDSLPGWMSPSGRIDQNDLTVFAQANVGRQGYVSIGGTTARARLIPASQRPDLADRWKSKSVSVGGGFGAFGARLIGHVVSAPGQAGKWEGLGVGLTWRTPWRGQLSVGADNLVTRGKNPFAPANADGDTEGTVPYVRYEQDL